MISLPRNGKPKLSERDVDRFLKRKSEVDAKIRQKKKDLAREEDVDGEMRITIELPVKVNLLEA
ncbi:TPA: hypothetical protein QCP80_003255 [Bacillus cereus]|nr:hypothetical protein [Bacillus cereus]